MAHDQRLDRTVAVKRIPVADAATAARAQREAVAAARLGHPGIVALYEAGSDGEAVYLVSELVRGRTLADLIAADALSDREILSIGVTLCDALAHAHGRGVIHRDVKPQNVMVPDPGDDGGPAKLTDFGVARVIAPAAPPPDPGPGAPNGLDWDGAGHLVHPSDALTRTGDVMGTLAYMAPEQADGGPVGEEADLYALGLVLYEALTGVNPVRGASAAATARRIGRQVPPLSRLRRDLPARLLDAIDRAVLPHPPDRGSVADLRGALAQALPGAEEEPATILVGGLRAPVRENPAAAGWAGRLSAAGAAAALTAAAFALLGPAPPVRPAAGAAAVAVVVALLPRAGWVAAAAALVGWLAVTPAAAGTPGDSSGVALLVALGALPTAFLLRRVPPGWWWSAPALAPALGLAGLAGAWPAVAARAGRPMHRAALGALGCWWLALSEPLLGRHLLLGVAPGTWVRADWEGSALLAAAHAATPLVAGGVLAVAAWWALAAALLPALVRGRTPALDLVAATTWAAALAAGTRAIAQALPWPGGAPQVRGLVLGAVAAGVAAVVTASWSRADDSAPARPPTPQ